MESAVNLHLSFDGYKPIRMQEVLASKEGEESFFTLHRMVPPGTLTYFYSVGDPQQLAKDPHIELVTLIDSGSPTKNNQRVSIAIGE